ncbi:hypothetical protein EYR40_010167 [Pleurotus pulmonarius]|nr:hypothetical protein EYR36_010437 [Pleurotus pulmonarius]KAF4588614.1 hypothetical protein EYR40_010167 [Pleurotus pulmonarius]
MDPNMSCSSTGSLHDYYCDYYNFYPSVGSSYSNDSTMSTRSKQCAAGVYKRNRHNMDSALKDDLCGLILGGVEMEEYVEKIYGVSEDDFKYIKSKDWKLVGLPVYTKLLNAGAPEEDLYAPFKTIMANLFDTFIQDKKRLNVHHASLGKTALKSVGSVRKPDQLFFFGSHNDESPITWSLAKAFVEFAVTPSAQRRKKEAQPETQVVLDDDNDVFAPLKEGQVPANMNIDDDDESDHDEEKESEPHLPPPPAAPAKAIDYDTLGGCLTFENFMAALKWTPRVIRPVDNKNQASEAK